ncbi:GHKL domain protein [uncultured Eubacteriales bacterium]|uniref:histidine kinase n=1 Tax=uncultured Eubacteriales bacterium TaxID=172733 RepID=A0A212J6E7_9FIRM|nr:GHKL domain protein [uncultured Eubacteriales bacterium]
MKNTLQFKNISIRILIILAILCAASIIGFAFREINLPETNIAIVYLLAVLLATLLAPGYIYGFITSVLSAFAFNYLFMEPYFKFTANAPSYIITFIIMTITAFITSSLASHAKINEHSARERESETKALYALTNQLTDATDIHDIAGIAADAISKVICERSACLCFDEKGMPEKSFIQQVSDQKQIWREVPDSDAVLHRNERLRTGVDIGTEFYDWPIYGRETALGIIRIPSEQAQFLSKAQTRLLRSMIESVALAMDRFRSAQQRIRSREETEHERYRSNLLRSISHDLRTPLSGILGATEMLSSMTEKEDRRYDLIEGISNDAHWLFSLVENVLSLTRLQDGKLVINKQQEVVEEVLGGTVEYMSRRYPDYEIEAHAPDELLLAPMDAKLINQVLINLIDNAVKHTSPPGEISITVSRDAQHNQAVFSVQDTGCGIAQSDLPHIFQMFYTSNSSRADSQMGIGLGLAICESIIKAHGGTIAARNRMDKTGAEFIFTLPLEEE